MELEYCRIKELEEQPEKSEGQKELLFNHRYIEECLSKVKNHGFAFFYCGDYDKCSSFFCQEAIGLKNAISAKMGGSFDLKEIEKAMAVKKQSGLKDLCSSYKMSLFIRAISSLRVWLWVKSLSISRRALSYLSASWLCW